MKENSKIEFRKPIWNVLSEFYLDTELQNSDYDRITEILIASNFDINKLKAIDLLEVFPVLKENLLTPAGVWNGFDKDWLYKNCKYYYKKRNRLLFQVKIKIYNILFGWMRKKHWAEIEIRMKT